MQCLMECLNDDPFPTRETWIARVEVDESVSLIFTFSSFCSKLAHSKQERFFGAMIELKKTCSQI